MASESLNDKDLPDNNVEPVSADSSGNSPDESNSLATVASDVDKTRGLRSSFRQMKKRYSGRKFSLNERVSNAKLDVEHSSSPPPSPANQQKAQEEKTPDPNVTEDLERVKEILNELPIATTDNSTKSESKEENNPFEEENSNKNDNSKQRSTPDQTASQINEIVKEDKQKVEDEQTDVGTDGSRSERPVDIPPTALRSPNKSQHKQSVGARVAFIEPVRSVKKDRRRTQKIGFENMKEVELKKLAFLEDNEDEHVGKLFGNEDADLDKAQEFEKSKTEKFLNLILCRKDLAEKKLTEKPVSVRQLFKYGSRLDNLLVVLGIIMAASCGFCQPLFAVVSGQLANALLLLDTEDPEFYQTGFRAIMMFIAVGIFLCIFAFLQFCCFNVACLRIIRRIRVNYLRSILRQNAAWFELNHSGALNTRLNDNIERIYEGIGDKFGLLIRNGVHYVIGLIVAFVWSWQMAAPLCVLSPIIASAMSISARWISDASRKEMGIYAEAGEIAEEAIAGVKTVVAFNGQQIEVDRYQAALDKGMKSGLRKGFHSGILSGFLLATVMVFMGSAILYGTYLYSIDVIKTPGDIFVVLLAIMSGAYHLGMATPHLTVMLTARVAAATVYKTIDRVPPIDPYSQEGRKIYDMRGKIVFKNVTFRYPSRRDCKVLKNFSLTIQPGQTIALVGHSGSGKSTVAGILNRLYEFESGSVSIDGHDLRELNVKWLRSVIGTVQQEPVVFNATIEENLRMGCATLTEKQMVTACQLANAHEFIEALPSGYQTRIGEGGVQLSGGQRQRLVIARVLAQDPKILILDEATSALDTDSERIVQDALNNASKGRSTIMIAHRLSTVRNADRIIVMQNGKFVEAGTHNELLERRGAYAKLVRTQQVDATEPDENLTSSSSDSEEDPQNEHLSENEVRESVRQSFKRDFMSSEHLGDAETEALQIELSKEGGISFSLAQLFLEARNLWVSLGVALAICLFNALSMPVTAIIYGQAFAMFEDGHKDTMYDAFRFFIFFVILGVIAGVAGFATTYLFNRIGEKLTMHLRLRAFSNILDQDASYFDNPQHTPGKLITRLATDAPNVKAAMDMRLSQVCQGLLSLFTAIIFSMFIDLPLTLVCSILFILQGLLQFFLARKVHRDHVKKAQTDEAGRYAVEAIENVRTIQLLACEDAIFTRFNDISKQQLRMDLLTAPFNALNFASTHGLQQFTQAFCYTCGFFFVMAGFSMKVAVFQVVQTLYFGSMGVLQASVYFPEFVKSRLAASLMFNIINQKPRTGDPNSGEKLTIDGTIEFDQVYFSYPHASKTAVLKGVSMHASSGKTVALVGSSGSGKSTLLTLLERFYDPSAGQIKIDGMDLRCIHLHRLREQVAIVEQQPRLFSGTIRQNICYGLDANAISMDQIIEAAKMSNAHDFIKNLPSGYETEVGEKGAQLSGGEKQRICIARAIIRNPKVLLLDEATSALDSSAEKAVQEALDNARMGRTCLTIAHRLSSIINSDLIVVMEYGRIRELGNHAQLLAQKGRYYQLIKRQDLSATTE